MSDTSSAEEGKEGVNPPDKAHAIDDQHPPTGSHGPVHKRKTRPPSPYLRRETLEDDDEDEVVGDSDVDDANEGNDSKER